MTARPIAAVRPVTDEESKPSFTRGVFAGAVHDSLLFPYPPPLDESDPDEARVVRRLIKDLKALRGELIDPARIDAEETLSEDVIRALGETGMLGLTIPKEYGGLGL